MTGAIGVLLLLAGVSVFLMGAIRYFFPTTDSFVPDDFKRLLTLRTGAFIFIAGIILLRFF